MPDVNRTLETTTDQLARLWEAKPARRTIGTYGLAPSEEVELTDIKTAGLTISNGPITTHIIYALEGQGMPLQTRRLVQIIRDGAYKAVRSSVDFEGEANQRQAGTMSVEMFDGSEDRVKPVFSHEYRYAATLQDVATRAHDLLQAEGDAFHYESKYIDGRLQQVIFPDRVGSSIYTGVSDGSGRRFLTWEPNLGRATTLEEKARKDHKNEFKEWEDENKRKIGQRILLRGQGVRVRGVAFPLALNSEDFVANIIDHAQARPLLETLRRGM